MYDNSINTIQLIIEGRFMKANNKKSYLIISILTIVIISFSSIFAYATQSFTPSPLRGQEKSGWCWAAVTQTLLETKSYWKTQSQIATFIFGYPNNSGADIFQMQRAAQWGTGYNLQYDVTLAPLPFSGAKSVVSSINNGWAVAAQLGHPYIYYGHVMVITGYDTSNSRLWLQDPQGSTSTFPAKGVETWALYSAVTNGNYAGSKFSIWKGYKWETSLN
jgi:hypothetical protein